jgi:hypothetical protein
MGRDIISSPLGRAPGSGCVIELIKISFQISLLRSGPQYVPARGVQVWQSALAYVFVRAISLSWIEVVQTNILNILLELIISAALVYLGLHIVHKTPRLQQTLSALWMTSVIIWVVSVPVLIQIEPGLEAGPRLSVAQRWLVFGLVVWEWAVTAHIFRQALDQIWSVGILIAFSYSILLYIVLNGLTSILP